MIKRVSLHSMLLQYPCGLDCNCKELPAFHSGRLVPLVLFRANKYMKINETRHHQAKATAAKIFA